MAIWWLAVSKNEGHCSYEELKYRKILAQGWPGIGNLEALVSPKIRDEEQFKTIVNSLIDYAYGPHAHGLEENTVCLRNSRVLNCVHCKYK